MTGRPAGTAARQQHLLEAAIEVVGESGLRGLTHRAVDRRAGLPEGTCSVYYRTRLALLTALTDHVAQRLTGDVDQLAARLVAQGALDPQRSTHEAAELLVRWSRSPALVMTIIELSLEAARTPSLQESVQRWRDRLSQIVQTIVECSGKPNPAVRAQVVVSSMEGLVLAAINLPDRSRAAYLRETTELLILSLSAVEAGSLL